LSLAFDLFKLVLLTSHTALNDSSKAVLDEMIAQMSEAELAQAQKLVAEWTPQPTALTIKARGGIAKAEAYLRRKKK
jgi:uncharacterized protein